MSSQRFTPEFKEEAVRQVVECGYTESSRSRCSATRQEVTGPNPNSALRRPLECFATLKFRTSWMWAYALRGRMNGLSA